MKIPTREGRRYIFIMCLSIFVVDDRLTKRVVQNQGHKIMIMFDLNLALFCLGLGLDSCLSRSREREKSRVGMRGRVLKNASQGLSMY